ncbi:MAG TPA: DNA glycosylase [Candidatus Udaeobacter sp.]
MIEISAPDFDLAMTLDSGQVFHWQRADNGFLGAIGDLPVYVEQRGELLRAKVASASSRHPGNDAQDARATISHYFALDHPLAEICASFPLDPVMNAARDFCHGLRIIRQPKWECLATFICSSMKQVAHIRQISTALRNRFGDEREIGSRVLYTFPSAQQIARASEKQLRACALGYRAKNLRATAQLVSSGECNLEAWSALSDAELRTHLCALPGVGAKVANCVMLFAYERLRAFPIDVWIERVLRQQYFPRRRKMTAQRLREFSETYFGEHGGYAQQYLFHHARIALRKSGIPRDSSTPKAFGARNDKRRNARVGDGKSTSKSKIRNRSRNASSMAAQVVST